MPFDKKKAARYVKGVAEAYFYDINTFDTVYYTNKIQTGALNTSANEGAIEGAILNQLLMNVPDTIRVTGTFEAADFSLDARGLYGAIQRRRACFGVDNGNGYDPYRFQDARTRIRSSCGQRVLLLSGGERRRELRR